MSIFVVTTQAFSVTSEPVIVDWQYDAWGDSNLVVSGETSNQVTTDSVTFSFTLTNSGALDETGTVVRVELVDLNGDRVAITGQANTNPDDDSQWLVATEQTIIDSPFSQDAVWNSGDFAFIDAQVDEIIAAGGKFAIYTSNRNSMTSYDKLHTDVTPVFGQDWSDGVGEILPLNSALSNAGSWLNLINAYDGDDATFAEEIQVQIVNDVWFFGLDTTDHGPILQVDTHILMTIVGLTNDVLEFSVYLSDGGADPATYTQSTTPAPIAIAGGVLQTYSLMDVQNPVGDGSWTWADLGLLNVMLDGTKQAQPDAIDDYAVFEVWVVITVEIP